MPLKKGKKAHGSNVRELVNKYKSTGKIGKSKPKSLDAAIRQANAIAYKKQRGGK